MLWIVYEYVGCENLIMNNARKRVFLPILKLKTNVSLRLPFVFGR